MSAGSQCAVVGGGLTGFTVYATLLHGGVPPEEITVFDAVGTDPAAAWRRRAAAIRQRRMRSESDGHCRPTAFPGLAMRAARRRRSVRPLVESVCDRYHPTVEEFLDDVEAMRERLGWSLVVVQSRIERIRAVDGGFSLDGHGTFRHVLIAPCPRSLPQTRAPSTRTSRTTTRTTSRWSAPVWPLRPSGEMPSRRAHG